MSEKTKGSVKKFLRSAGMIMALLLLSFLGGFLFGKFLTTLEVSDDLQLFGMLGLFLLWLYLSMFLHTAAHEWGHYIFGRITGYRFASYRLGSFILIRLDGKLQIKRFSLAGTDGQCLMDPPDMKDGQVPYVLYNLGGSIVNLLLGLAAVIPACLLHDTGILTPLLWAFAIVGFAFALLNGIPMKVGMVNNDGHNALSLGKSPAALRSFWIQMKGNVLTGKGVRIKDMPAEWFVMPEEEELQNTMTAVLAVLACNRKMDEGKLTEADSMMEKLLSGKNAVLELHRRLLYCDRIFCLLHHDRPEEAATLYDKKQQKFMKSMKQFPSVLRTEYTIAILWKQDSAKAAEVLERFEKCEKIYPYPVEFESERELIDLAAEKAVSDSCTSSQNMV